MNNQSVKLTIAKVFLSNPYMSGVVALITLILTIIILVYTVRAFYLKNGIRVRSSFSPCSSIYSEDTWISSVVLENMKDKAIVIFNVYLKIGNNCYLSLEKFYNEPLVIKPFETVIRSYPQVFFYSLNTNRINLNNLLKDKTVKKRVVIHTSEGLHTIKKTGQYFDPTIPKFFNNHLTALIQPMTHEINNKNISNRALYVLELKDDHGDTKETKFFYPVTVKFDDQYGLLSSDLLSRETFEKFIKRNIQEGKISYKKYEIHDVQAFMKKYYGEKEILEMPKFNWFI